MQHRLRHSGALGNRIGGSSGSWSGWWRSQNVFDFFWYNTPPVGNDLVSILSDHRKIAITGKDFTTNYIPYTSTSTFKLVADADMITDDADLLWFTSGGSQEAVTVARIVDYDYTRTVVFYDNDSPYDIRAIGILKSTVTLTSSQLNRLHRDFSLWMFWSGSYNENGFAKENRAVEVIPSIVTVAVDTGSTADILITFSENMDQGSISAIAAFNIPGKTISTIVYNSALILKITVTVAFVGGDTPTLDYTKPIGNPIQSLLGGKLASFTGKVVTNGIPTMPQAANVIGNWQMNGNANDSTAHAYNLTVTNATLTTDRASAANKAYAFVTNCKLDRTMTAAELSTNNFTVCVWFKFNSFPNLRDLIIGCPHLGTYAAGWALMYDLATQVLRFWVGDFSTANYYVDIAFTDTTSWHCVVASFYTLGGVGNVRMSLDNAADVTATRGTAGIAAGGDFSTGFAGAVTRYLNGKIDGIILWNKVLTTEEKTQAYNYYL